MKADKKELLKNTEQDAGLLLPLAYAVRNLDESVRESSSSGGVFYALAEYILQCGGVVYGAVFDEKFQVVHMRGVKTDDIRKMQGSKYVQSSTVGIFEAVEKDLSEGKKVLFTGCPCQIDGLKHYLGECRQDGLFTCDLICHGANSPRIWQDYLKYRTKKEPVKEVCFRGKSEGWHNLVMHIRTDQTEYKESSSYDFFYQAFFGNYILRDSCYVCRYADLRRVGDITIGDFWGIGHVCPQMDDNKGVYLVLLNSARGREVFKKLGNSFLAKKVDIRDSLQPSLQNPSGCPEKYGEFWSSYFQKGFSFICKKYLGGGIRGRVRRSLKQALLKAGIWEYLEGFRRRKNEAF